MGLGLGFGPSVGFYKASVSFAKRVSFGIWAPNLLRELGSGKVGYNKYELANVMMVRKMDGAYFARQISKAKNIRIW